MFTELSLLSQITMLQFLKMMITCNQQIAYLAYLRKFLNTFNVR